MTETEHACMGSIAPPPRHRVIIEAFAIVAMPSTRGKVKAKVEADMKKVEVDVKKAGADVRKEAGKLRRKK
jgi:hypothetical protein